MVAGFAGLVLGTWATGALQQGEGADVSPLLGLFALDIGTLELIVYQGLAVIFIAVGLQEPVKTKGGSGARSVAFALPMFAAIQAIVGLSIAAALALHPGFGSLLPLGFQQGPGQALSLGEAWESTGLVDGGQVGLIIAAAGFAFVLLEIFQAGQGRCQQLQDDRGVDKRQDPQRKHPKGGDATTGEDVEEADQLTALVDELLESFAVDPRDRDVDAKPDQQKKAQGREHTIPEPLGLEQLGEDLTGAGGPSPTDNHGIASRSEGLGFSRSARSCRRQLRSSRGPRR